MNKTYSSIFAVLIALFVTACSSSSSDTQAYSCTLPCLEAAPAISTTSISSATGGIVDVTLNFSGNITDIDRVDIFLRDVSSGNNAGFIYVFTPTTQSLTESIPVVSGTTISSYYPYVVIYTTTNSTSSRYYSDSSLSSNQYIYYEIKNGNASQNMISPYTIPMLQVN